MYYTLKEQLESYQDLDVKKTPNFKAMVMLRDRLYELDTETRFTKSVANGVAARCKIELSALDGVDDLDSLIEGLIIPFSNVVYRMIITMFDAGFSVNDVFALVERDLVMVLK